MRIVSLSVTEASRNFADCVNRARYQGTTFVLHKNGVAVARIVPESSAGAGPEVDSTAAATPVSATQPAGQQAGRESAGQDLADQDFANQDIGDRDIADRDLGARPPVTRHDIW